MSARKLTVAGIVTILRERPTKTGKRMAWVTIEDLSGSIELVCFPGKEGTRNVMGKVIMYADNMTDSMARMIEETERRRTVQMAYNEETGITPQTVAKSVDQIRAGTAVADHRGSKEETRQPLYYAGPQQLPVVADPVVKYLTDDQKRDLIAQLTREMEEAAMELRFEKAAELRDSIAQIEESG